MPTNVLTVDYLVIGAGAMGMAFADVLVGESASTMAIVDRNDAPGGHWTVSYPFVRLHGPSNFYGVISRPMPSDEGTRSRASRNEILDYYDRGMRETLLASGRVTYLPKHHVDVAEPGRPARARSLVTGETTEIVVRKRVVDASYMNITVPAIRPAGFDVDDAATVVPINQLPELDRSPERFTVIGAGKTGIDACLWLLERGIDPDRLTWIVPRDAWLINRELEWQNGGFQPLLNLLMCRSADEVIRVLEEKGVVIRRDVDIEPAAFRCATVDTEELVQLRRIKNVVRLGRVRAVGATTVTLDEGTIPTTPETVHIDCTADGLTQKPLKPVFEDGAITLQPLLPCLLPPSAAVAARLECMDGDDEWRNGLCPPVVNPGSSRDLLSFYSLKLERMARWARSPELFEWLVTSRFMSGAGLEKMAEPDAQAAAFFFASRMEDLLKADAAVSVAG
ncbi:NAD(P)/FAD-dependent oxidoreductase [Streptomyces sp. NPDC005263]|uniref:NAD(P)/FAD-dependent oxidoreductase n=1 Tax=Streptomyces sp. NPDC005263 TaxID=3364711 RepID=UPI00368199E3